MLWMMTKYAVTAGLVVLITELAKRSDRLGALLAALPMITILALIWMQLENQPSEKIAKHAWYTFWYVLPTLPMFIAFPFLYSRLGFWPTLLVCCGMSIAIFLVYALILRKYGIQLL